MQERKPIKKAGSPLGPPASYQEVTDINYLAMKSAFCQKESLFSELYCEG